MAFHNPYYAEDLKSLAKAIVKTTRHFAPLSGNHPRFRVTVLSKNQSDENVYNRWKDLQAPSRREAQGAIDFGYNYRPSLALKLDNELKQEFKNKNAPPPSLVERGNRFIYHKFAPKKFHKEEDKSQAKPTTILAVYEQIAKRIVLSRSIFVNCEFLVAFAVTNLCMFKFAHQRQIFIYIYNIPGEHVLFILSFSSRLNLTVPQAKNLHDLAYAIKLHDKDAYICDPWVYAYASILYPDEIINNAKALKISANLIKRCYNLPFIFLAVTRVPDFNEKNTLSVKHRDSEKYPRIFASVLQKLGENYTRQQKKRSILIGDELRGFIVPFMESVLATMQPGFFNKQKKREKIVDMSQIKNQLKNLAIHKISEADCLASLKDFVNTGLKHSSSMHKDDNYTDTAETMTKIINTPTHSDCRSFMNSKIKRHPDSFIENQHLQDFSWHS